MEMDGLTLEGLLKGHRMITDDTQIIIRDNSDTRILAVGNWFEDNVLERVDKPISCLSYYAVTDRLHIILK